MTGDTGPVRKARPQARSPVRDPISSEYSGCPDHGSWIPYPLPWLKVSYWRAIEKSI